MIYIKDDFLDINIIDLLRTNKDEFQEVKTPGKSFWVKEVPAPIMQIIKFELEDLEGNRIEPILGFMREAKEGQDRDWRIHNDSIIEGQQPDRACVLYISDCKQEGLNGTAFWEHKKHGDKFENVSLAEQNRLLKLAKFKSVGVINLITLLLFLSIPNELSFLHFLLIRLLSNTLSNKFASKLSSF